MSVCIYEENINLPFRIFLPPKLLNVDFTYISFVKEQVDVENFIFIVQ